MCSPTWEVAVTTVESLTVVLTQCVLGAGLFKGSLMKFCGPFVWFVRLEKLELLTLSSSETFQPQWSLSIAKQVICIP